MSEKIIEHLIDTAREDGVVEAMLEINNTDLSEDCREIVSEQVFETAIEEGLLSESAQREVARQRFLQDGISQRDTNEDPILNDRLLRREKVLSQLESRQRKTGRKVLYGFNNG